MMFHSCSISVFINLLIGLDIIPTVRIGGSEPKMGERPRAPTQPLLLLSLTVLLCPFPGIFVDLVPRMEVAANTRRRELFLL